MNTPFWTFAAMATLSIGALVLVAVVMRWQLASACPDLLLMQNNKCWRLLRQ
jgi:hypothetical protein